MTESTLEKEVPVDMFHIALGRVDNLFVCLRIETCSYYIYTIGNRLSNATVNVTV